MKIGENNRAFYQAGSDSALANRLRIPLKDRDVDITHSDLVVRWIEFWCQGNCNGAWYVRGFHDHVDVGFEDAEDLVMFKLGPEFEIA